LPKTISMDMQSKELLDLVIAALEELKARNVRTLDVRELTSVTDYMVIASGTSDRQVRSLAENVVRRTKAAGQPPLGMEGEREGEWVLVDLCDVVVHVMLPEIRDFYQLEKLWGEPGQTARTAPPGSGAT